MRYVLVNLLLHVVCIYLLAGCSSDSPLLNISKSALNEPKPNMPFSKYVEESKKSMESAIRLALSQLPAGNDDAYIGGYSIADAVDMRAPFEKLAEDGCTQNHSSQGMGILFVHGLMDSPFLLNGVADDLKSSEHFPCALMRGIALPGHSTIAGDSLEMTYLQWQKATQYGVDSMLNEVSIDRVYLVGFSTGTSLIVRHVTENLDAKSKVKGVVLLSAAMKAKQKLAYLSPVLSVFKDWLVEYPEFDAARYTSFSTNAGAQFYKLTKPISAEKNALELPMMMVVSADDQTIDPQAALDIFCAGTRTDKNQLIWYQSEFTERDLRIENTQNKCSGEAKIIPVKMDKELFSISKRQYRVANIAHTAISISPNDEHYGPFGKFRQCKHYWGKPEYKKCIDVTNDQLINEIVFAEENAKDKIEKGGKLYVRGTFNPYYDSMLSEISLFIRNIDTLQNSD